MHKSNGHEDCMKAIFMFAETHPGQSVNGFAHTTTITLIQFIQFFAFLSTEHKIWKDIIHSLAQFLAQNKWKHFIKICNKILSLNFIYFLLFKKKLLFRQIITFSTISFKYSFLYKYYMGNIERFTFTFLGILSKHLYYWFFVNP